MSGGADLAIRPLTRADWPEVYAFFTAIVAAGRTYAYPPDLDPDAAYELWTAPGHTVVAVREGRVVGSATTGPNRPGRGAHIATASFMVDPDARGGGVGRRLGEYVIERCRREGFHGIQFNAVVETNSAAVGLWQSLGFEVVGTVPEAFDDAQLGLVGLHVMYRRLSR